jgi:nitrite reductase/ring-hydroxylating ferredoxin subunit
MDHPSEPGQLLRRGFLTGLVGVCSGCLLAGCGSSSAPLGGPAPATSAPVPVRTAGTRRPTASPTRSPGARPSDAGGRTPSSGGSTTPPATADPTTKARPTTGGDPTKRPGGDGTEPPSPPVPSKSPRPTRSPSPTDPAQGALVEVTNVPLGGGVVLPMFGVVVTQPSAGDIRAFSARCTHRQCVVGKVVSAEIVCPCHSSRFSIVDGSVLGGPAKKALPAESVRVANGYVYLA